MPSPGTIESAKILIALALSQDGAAVEHGGEQICTAVIWERWRPTLCGARPLGLLHHSTCRVWGRGPRRPCGLRLDVHAPASVGLGGLVGDWPRGQGSSLIQSDTKSAIGLVMAGERMSPAMTWETGSLSGDARTSCMVASPPQAAAIARVTS